MENKVENKRSSSIFLETRILIMPTPIALMLLSLNSLFELSINLFTMLGGFLGLSIILLFLFQSKIKKEIDNEKDKARKELIDYKMSQRLKTNLIIGPSVVALTSLIITLFYVLNLEQYMV